MENTLARPYKRIDGLDKKCKPLILKWLCSVFGYENYPHSFRDQYILWSVWEGDISVSFDSRVDEQNKLLSLIPARFKGVPQYKTLKIVNENNFYLQIRQLLHVEYPKIIDSKLVKTNKHKDNDGDTFFTYDWEVLLSDNTSIEYHNQLNKMDLVENGVIYNKIIQERVFVNFLLDFK